MKLGPYQETVPISEVPPEHLPELLAALIEYLNVVIVREQTPDYASYDVLSRNAVNQ